MTQTISQLSRREIFARLKGRGLALRTGPFTYSLRSDIGRVVEGLMINYADFPVLSPGEDDLVDYHLGLHYCRWPFVSRRCQLYMGGAGWLAPAPERIALATLEWGMNSCVYVLGTPHLMLHAAVLERDDRGLLLVGPSGSGKSTLCAALVMEGWRLLSDELALISPRDGLLSAIARPIILKNRSIEIIRDRYPQAVFGPVSRRTNKGDVAHLKPPRDSVRRVDQPAAPHLVYLVDYRAGVDTEVRPMSEGQAMVRLAKSSFNYGMLGRTGFETLATMVDACETAELVFGDLNEALALIHRHYASTRASAANVATVNST